MHHVVLLKDFWLHFGSSEIKVKIAVSALSTKTEPAARAEMSFTAVIPSWWLWCFIQKFLGIPLCFSGSRTTVRRREVGCFCLKISSITHFDFIEFLGTPHWHNILQDISVCWNLSKEFIHTRVSFLDCDLEFLQGLGADSLNT